MISTSLESQVDRVRQQESLMNHIYRLQSKIYDATRWMILLGRNFAIQQLCDLPAQAAVLELGCGTARNLLRSAKLFPGFRFYGCELSGVMLARAQRKLAQRKYGEKIQLVHCAAERTHFARTFGRGEAFDAILISFVLTMLPDQKALLDVLENAKSNLKPGGKIIIIDYSGYGPYPRWFRNLMLAWQKTVHVYPSTFYVDILREWEERGLGKLVERSFLWDATRLAVFTHNPERR